MATFLEKLSAVSYQLSAISSQQSAQKKRKEALFWFPNSCLGTIVRKRIHINFTSKFFYLLLTTDY
jgi:hypothetical protein